MQPLDDTASAPSGRLRRKERRIDWWQLLGVGPLLVVIIALFGFLSPFFFQWSNIVNTLREASVVYVLAAGLTMVMLAGGFDLSIGSMLAFAGILLYYFLTFGIPAPLAILAALAVCMGIGFFGHGLLIAKGKLSFFVVTLGSMSMLRGLVYVATNGETNYTDQYALVQFIGDGKVLGLSVPVFITIAVYLLMFFILGYTRFGRAVYAVGGNDEAAALAGVNVVRVRMVAYGVCALLAGLGGVLTVGRLSAASPVVGSGVELSVAAAVLLGGTSFEGGEGGLRGTLLGMTFVVVLQNGLGLVGLSSFWQGVVTGFVLIAAVGVDRMRSSRS